MRRALVLGGAGFIGTHLVRRLHADGYAVDVIDRMPPYENLQIINFIQIRDLRKYGNTSNIPWHQYDIVFQLAANMGGAGFVFDGKHDAEIMTDNVLINANILRSLQFSQPKRIIFASSACVYRETGLASYETDAYPAKPDSEYGWEKLFSERMYMAFARNKRLSVGIVRLHNVFGPECVWDGGREKSIAAICRKIAQADDNGTIEIFGSGNQVRSYLYITEAVEGLIRLTDSNVNMPLNLGSDRAVSLNDIVTMIARIARKNIKIKTGEGPIGVYYRNSDNRLIRQMLGFEPNYPLWDGLEKTYAWIKEQVDAKNTDHHKG